MKLISLQYLPFSSYNYFDNRLETMECSNGSFVCMATLKLGIKMNIIHVMIINRIKNKLVIVN